MEYALLIILSGGTVAAGLEWMIYFKVETLRADPGPIA
jgi:hypothetical protein